MEIISIGSSSSGNSYIIKTEGAKLLLDVGLSASKIVKGLEQTGISPDEVDAVLITHEHIDHIRSVRAISKKCENAKFYVSRGTMENCSNFADVEEERICCISCGDEFEVGSVKISCFKLSHDAAEPIGYSFTENGHKLSVVTDTGIITDEIFDEIKTSDTLVFEANHEENLLMVGQYPYYVKMRIKSDHGHLSNVYAGEVLARVLDERDAESELLIMLAHLSENNNTAYQARMTIEDVLREKGYERDKHYSITIAAKEGLTIL